MPLLLAYPQELVEKRGWFMLLLERSIAAATMAGLFALVGKTESTAEVPEKPVESKKT